jgi:hypothetical protein
MTSRTFDQFCAKVRDLLEPAAASKGYSLNGADGPNALYEFVEAMNGGPGHATGEVIYKIRRYAAKRNPEDLLKAAAWCWLMYRHHRE